MINVDAVMAWALLNRLSQARCWWLGNKCLKVRNINVPKYHSKFFSLSTVLHEEIPRENLPISRYPIPDMKTLPINVQKRMEETAEKSKFMPNVHQALSHRPAEFDAFFNYYDILMNEEHGSLTKAEKELIVVATSAKNGCLYCVISHSALYRIYSKRPYVADQVATNHHMADLTEREKVIVDFALKVSQMTNIVDEDFESLAKQGLDKEDAWDIGAIASFFAMSNRMAHLTDMRPNEEFYTMGRVPRQKVTT